MVKPDGAKRDRAIVPSGRRADGSPAVLACRRNPRGRAPESLNSRLAWALSSASVHPRNCRRRKLPKRSRNSRRSLRRPVSTSAASAKSSRNSGPSLGRSASPPTRSRPGDSRFMLMIRRASLCVRSQASMVRREPQNPRAKCRSLAPSALRPVREAPAGGNWRGSRRPKCGSLRRCGLRPAGRGH